MNGIKKYVTLSDAVVLLVAGLLVYMAVEVISQNARMHMYDRGAIAFAVVALVFSGMMIGAFVNRLSHTIRLQKQASASLKGKTAGTRKSGE